MLIPNRQHFFAIFFHFVTSVYVYAFSSTKTGHYYNIYLAFFSIPSFFAWKIFSAASLYPSPFFGLYPPFFRPFNTMHKTIYVFYWIFYALFLHLFYHFIPAWSFVTPFSPILLNKAYLCIAAGWCCAAWTDHPDIRSTSACCYPGTGGRFLWRWLWHRNNACAEGVAIIRVFGICGYVHKERSAK